MAFRKSSKEKQVIEKWLGDKNRKVEVKKIYRKNDKSIIKNQTENSDKVRIQVLLILSRKEIWKKNTLRASKQNWTAREYIKKAGVDDVNRKKKGSALKKC